MKYSSALVIALILVLTSTSLMQTAQALGPFDQACPNCQGTGKVTTHTTQSCSVCGGRGTITATGTCNTCHGSGQVTTYTTCSSCGGDGKVAPDLVLKSKNCYGTLSGLDWVARVEATYHNEEDTGTYGVVKSVVHTVTQDYTHYSSRTYFAPHTDVKVVIDTSEIGLLTDYTYYVSLSSVDDIACKACGGSGSKATLTTCSDCHGTGQVTRTDACSICHGTGQVTVDNQITCSQCSGSGSVTNWGTISIVIVVGLCSIVGIVATGVYFARRK